ncbi:MAG: hypothetical protein CVT60_04515 [Actinobacteria bacterium HGW-Actinobacteria-10]|nr:MAG: hypothetical protein CVT60_04515 [Actinobacteria bacterium HGW-Actinobacteria-10]
MSTLEHGTEDSTGTAREESSVDAPQSGSSPYATGGGGVLLEHCYGALALSSLLLGESMVGLGVEYQVTSVAMQQESRSPVDDLIVTGVASDSKRTIRVACRRRPTIGSSSSDTVSLFVDYLDVLLSAPVAVESGELRLGLAVSGRFGPATQLAELTEVARRQQSAPDFEIAINTPGAHTRAVRDRLTNTKDLVRAALDATSRNADIQTVAETTWSMLKALYVLQEELEGDTASGVTAMVGRLQSLAFGPSRASELHRRLVEVAGQSGIRAGAIDRATLRRELRPFGQLGVSRDFSAYRSQIESLETALLQRTDRMIPRWGEGDAFRLTRSNLIEELTVKIRSMQGGGVLLVRGEPDVGKSALALDVLDVMRSTGGSAIALSLRDLPQDVLTFGSLVGASATDLLSSAETGPDSLLLLDGAEVIQERDDQVLPSLLTAAASVGLVTVLVARDDATGTLRELVKRVGLGEPGEQVVAEISSEESSSLLEAMPELAPLASGPRAAWLFRRLGIVDQIVRSAIREGRLPTSLQTEAEVAQMFWSACVRTSEKVVGGVAPDDRDSAVTAVARSLLGASVTTPTGTALVALRSDGILLPRDSTTAWRTTDAFASDVIRDFALATVLVRDGLSLLIDSSAPRWAIRAVRLYAQAQLGAAAPAGDQALLEAWRTVRSEFDLLASAHGARWNEVLWEAVLSAGWSDQVLGALTPLLQSDASLLKAALNCLKLRFSLVGAADPVVGAPVLEWILDRCDFAQAFTSYQEEDTREFILSWLKGLARREVSGEDIETLQPLRVRLRTLLLDLDPGHQAREEWLECLGLLGGDADIASRQALVGFAQQRPAFLAPLVESFDVANSLSANDASLLLELAEAYYIEQPRHSPWGSSSLDDGIRHHRSGGFRSPMAAWYLGPFWHLLNADFTLGLGLIDKMLDHGARGRLAVLDDLTRRHEPGESRVDEGLELDLLGLGPRNYLGDTHVWSWYRGSSVGPYACMSALLALELMMDAFVRAEVPIRLVAARVLRDASTLASAGLACGFLVRHLDKVTDELDEYLARPEVWQLEVGRVVSEGTLHVQGADPEGIDGKERRKWTPHSIASHLVVMAMTSGDTDALARLKAVGDRLLDAAGGEDAPAFVRQWVANFDPSTYSFTEVEGGLLVEVNPGEDVEKELAEGRDHSALIQEMYRLQNRYRLRQLIPYRVDFAESPAESELAADYIAALKVENGLPNEPLDGVRSALAVVAAAVLEASAAGSVIPEGSVEWSIGLLVDAALDPFEGSSSSWASMFSWGSDRTAAFALPSALVSPGATSDGRLVDALAAGMSSTFVEVRRYAAEGIRRALRDCESNGSTSEVHELLWSAIEAGVRSIVLGPWGQTSGHRGIETIDGDLLAELPKISAENLMLPHLMPACAAVLEAASSSTCISERAARLVPVLLDAYGRAACHSAEHDYGERDEWRAAVTASLIRMAGDNVAPAILEMVDRLQPAPRAFSNLLKDLQLVATYEKEASASLTAVWPTLMSRAIGRLGGEWDSSERHARESLVEEMMPSPRPSSFPGNFDEELASARLHWLPVESVADHMDDWLRLARGEMSCVDQLVGFLEAQPLDVQVNPGLAWVRKLVVGDDGTALTSGFLLVGWLTRLRESRQSATKSSADYRAVVDALVLGDYNGARELQARDE